MGEVLEDKTFILEERSCQVENTGKNKCSECN